MNSNEWFCTDSVSSQYCRINSDGTYDFVEKVWIDLTSEDDGYPDKCFTVKSMTMLDLSEYTIQ